MKKRKNDEVVNQGQILMAGALAFLLALGGAFYWLVTPADTSVVESVINELNPNAPTINSVITQREAIGSRVIIVHEVSFIDREGDAITADWRMVDTDASRYMLEDGTITANAFQQQQGATFESQWNCEGESYSVQMELTLIDLEGNESIPYPVSFSCP